MWSVQECYQLQYFVVVSNRNSLVHHQEKDYMFFFYIMKNCLILLLSKEQDRVATGVFWGFGKAIKKRISFILSPYAYERRDVIQSWQAGCA